MTVPAFDPRQEPQHPDYGRLCTCLQGQMDAIGEDGAEGLQEYVAQYVDPHSISHVAVERSLGLQTYESPEELLQVMPDVMRATAQYLEAFTLGVAFAQMGASEDEVLARVMRRILKADALILWTDEITLASDQYEHESIPIDPIEHATLSDVVNQKETG